MFARSFDNFVYTTLPKIQRTTFPNNSAKVSMSLRNKLHKLQTQPEKHGWMGRGRWEGGTGVGEGGGGGGGGVTHACQETKGVN